MKEICIINSFVLKDIAQTKKLAKLIAQVIVPDFVVTLNGELGAGKTALVKEILYALGIKITVKSPTFTIVEPYNIGNLAIYHFDLYRFSNPDEWFHSGFDEYFTANSICFIEWADRAKELIPVIDWQINIGIESSNNDMYVDELKNNCDIAKMNFNQAKRIAWIESRSKKGEQCLKRLINSAAELFS